MDEVKHFYYQQMGHFKNDGLMFKLDQQAEISLVPPRVIQSIREGVAFANKGKYKLK